MAYTISADGTRIHYEVHGSGDPVLLIMGLGSNAYGWHRTIPWLAERYQAIAFDNRGTGRSTSRPAPMPSRRWRGTRPRSSTPPATRPRTWWVPRSAA